MKLTRKLDREKSKYSFFGQTKEIDANITISITNLSGHQALTVNLSDRIPLSKNDEIRVRGVHIKPESDPDEDGIVRWKVKLAPSETKDYQLEYSVRYPAEFTAAPPVPPAASNALRRESDQRAMPKGGEREALYDQLRQLEANF